MADDKGINRDIAKAQEVTFNEGMEATVNIPPEAINAVVGVVAAGIDRILSGVANNASEQAVIDARDKLMSQYGLSKEEADKIARDGLDVLSGRKTLEEVTSCSGAGLMDYLDYLNPLNLLISNAYASGTCDASHITGSFINDVLGAYKRQFDNYLATYKDKNSNWLADKYVDSDDPIEKAAIYAALITQLSLQPGSSVELVLTVAGGAIAKGVGKAGGAVLTKIDDILIPGGKLVGVKASGAGSGIRTVTSEEFSKIQSSLLQDAKPITTPSSYNGTWYKRSDGSIFGIRNNDINNVTIDIINSNSRLLPTKFKVHQK